MASAPTHLMELPRKILIGDGVISSLGAFVRDIGYSASKVAFVTGNTVKRRASADVTSSFQSMSIDDTWYVVVDSSIASVNKLKKSLAKAIPDILSLIHI